MISHRLFVPLLTASLAALPLSAQHDADHAHKDPVRIEKGEIGPPAPQPTNAWFRETLSRDLGAFLQGETASGQFPFSNPHSETHRLSSITPNCQCAKATIVVGDRRYAVENQPVQGTIFRIDGEGDQITRTKVKHIAVAGGESGYVQIDMDLKGIRGKKEAFVTMRLTDDALPSVRVTASATGLEYFRVIPPDINLNKMAWSEKREFSFEISSDVAKDFEVTNVEPNAKGLVVTNKEKVMRGDQAFWRISGSYGPDIDPKAGGGALKVLTDIKSKSGQTMSTDVRVIAIVTGPMTISPGTFLQFGRVKRAQGASRSIEFQPNDGFDLAFDSVEIEGLTVDEEWVEVVTGKNGTALTLEVKVKPGAPRGKLVRGDVRVKLNHPAVEETLVSFNGFVR